MKYRLFAVVFSLAFGFSAVAQNKVFARYTTSAGGFPTCDNPQAAEEIVEDFDGGRVCCPKGYNVRWVNETDHGMPNYNSQKYVCEQQFHQRGFQDHRVSSQ